MMNTAETPIPELRLKRADLKPNTEHKIAFTADDACCADLADRLGFLAVKKLRFEGQLSPVSKQDWLLEATLGATIEQACVVSLNPVTTRIEERVERRYTPDLTTDDETTETEMNLDTSLEPLGAEIDIGRVIEETLALAAPTYPRVPNAELTTATFSAPGTKPLTDQDMKPFADLANLRDKLSKGE